MQPAKRPPRVRCIGVTFMRISEGTWRGAMWVAVASALAIRAWQEIRWPDLARTAPHASSTAAAAAMDTSEVDAQVQEHHPAPKEVAAAPEVAAKVPPWRHSTAS